MDVQTPCVSSCEFNQFSPKDSAFLFFNCHYYYCYIYLQNLNILTRNNILNERGCLFLLLHSDFNWHANYEFFMMIISLNRTKGIIKMKEKMFCSSFRLHYWHERRQAGVVIAGTWLTMQQAFCFRSNNG